MHGTSVTAMREEMVDARAAILRMHPAVADAHRDHRALDFLLQEPPSVTRLSCYHGVSWSHHGRYVGHMTDDR